MKKLHFDLIIIGGGVAGLWTLNRAITAGFSAILLEKDSLGGAQTIHSQGIIHGGIKYALNGVLTQASNRIKEMPQRWLNCLNAEGEIDLSNVRQLSDAHYMWSQGSLTSRMTTFFATKSLRGRINEVAMADYPKAFANPAFRGRLYRLNELVLDIPSLIQELRNPVKDFIFKADINTAKLVQNTDGMQQICFPQFDLQLLPNNLVITAGEGVGYIAAQLDVALPSMQKRPLHMVMIKQPELPALFAHCIGAGSKPVATITTHPCADNNSVWYLGGDIAETGIKRQQEQQISLAKETMATLMPWVSLEQAQWSSLLINRAEPRQSTLTRPDSAYARKVGNCILAWPTKLALSPDLSDQILSLCDKKPEQPMPKLDELAVLPKPDISLPPWELHFG